MDMGDLGDFLETTLDFTLDGRRYSVQPVEWPVYLQLLAAQEHANAVAEGRAKVEDGPEDKPIYQLAPTVLGPVLAELISAGVSGPRISRIARAGYLFQLGEHEIAKVILQGKAPTPAPGSTSTTPTGSTGTAAGSTTRRRASTSGTTSPRKSSKPKEPARA
jgi:hypothetical protein